MWSLVTGLGLRGAGAQLEVVATGEPRSVGQKQDTGLELRPQAAVEALAIGVHFWAAVSAPHVCGTRAYARTHTHTRTHSCEGPCQELDD